MNNILPDDILFEEESHTYRFNGKEYLSVTQVIRLAGLGDNFEWVPPDRMEAAQLRGRHVHMACHFYDEGELDMDSVHGSIRPYVEAYIRFRQECPIKPIAVERKMVDLKMELAGTPDLICFLKGRRVVIDRKTSQHMSLAMGLQTAGYRMLWNAVNPNTPVYDRYGLRLEKSGKYRLFAHQDPCDESKFLDAVYKVKNAKGPQSV